MAKKKVPPPVAKKPARAQQRKASDKISSIAAKFEALTARARQEEEVFLKPGEKKREEEGGKDEPEGKGDDGEREQVE